MGKQKKNSSGNVANCECNKCHVVVNSTIGKQHRKCASAKNQENPGQLRGTWEKAS